MTVKLQKAKISKGLCNCTFSTDTLKDSRHLNFYSGFTQRELSDFAQINYIRSQCKDAYRRELAAGVASDVNWVTWDWHSSSANAENICRIPSLMQNNELFLRVINSVERDCCCLVWTQHYMLSRLVSLQEFAKTTVLLQFQSFCISVYCTSLICFLKSVNRLHCAACKWAIRLGFWTWNSELNYWSEMIWFFFEQ